MLNFIRTFFSSNRETLQEAEDAILVTASEAFESTKAPQLQKAIAGINSARRNGLTHTYVGDQERLHAETIKMLLESGYDISIHRHGPNDFESRATWFNEVFWDKSASGIIREMRGVSKDEWPEVASAVRAVW